MRIAGIRRGEVYPETSRGSSGASGPVVRLGYDNSTEVATYQANSEIFQAVLRSSEQRLRVPLTGFTPGNIIQIEFTIIPAISIVSGPTTVDFDCFACVDIGAGFQNVSKSQSDTVVTFNPRAAGSPVTVLSFVKPDSGSVTADPVVGVNLQTGLSGNDPFDIKEFGAFLVAYEIDASRVTQSPTTVLIP